MHASKSVDEQPCLRQPLGPSAGGQIETAIGRGEPGQNASMEAGAMLESGVKSMAYFATCISAKTLEPGVQQPCDFAIREPRPTDRFTACLTHRIF